MSEFHSGYRLYSVKALQRIPFELNANVFHFDTEIIIQFIAAGLRIKEIPIPTYYGDEICRVNGLRYAWDCLRSVGAARLQRYNLLYRANFDVASVRADNSYYEGKLDFDSSHTRALSAIAARQRVIDLGCGPGILAAQLKARECEVVGVDCCPPGPEHRREFDAFIVRDLNDGLDGIDFRNVDRVLLLDVVEHLYRPDDFCRGLRLALQTALEAKCVVTLPNIGFWLVRCMLLLGQFNYGKRGILDHTHTRLFTFASARRMFSECGFAIETQTGIPPPIPLAVKSRRLSRFLLWIHQWLTRWFDGLFSYQIFMVVRPLPTVQTLLEGTRRHSAARRAARTSESSR
jgi:SAM-dependent methyltransferase